MFILLYAVCRVTSTLLSFWNIQLHILYCCVLVPVPSILAYVLPVATSSRLSNEGLIMSLYIFLVFNRHTCSQSLLYQDTFTIFLRVCLLHNLRVSLFYDHPFLMLPNLITFFELLVIQNPQRFTYSAGGVAGCSETSVNVHQNARRRTSEHNNICFLDFYGIFIPSVQISQPYKIVGTDANLCNVNLVSFFAFLSNILFIVTNFN